MKLKYYLIICLFFFGCSDQETISGAKSYLFIIAGQSNALGRANNSELPNNIKNHSFNRTKIWTVEDDYIQTLWPNYEKSNYEKNGSKWENLNIKLTQSFSINHNQHGIDPYLAYNFEINNPIDTLYLIKFAFGGIGLNYNFNYLDWSPESNNEMFDYFKNKYIKGHLKENEFIYKGFFWSQGETDAQNDTSSINYYKNLSNFFLELENNFPVISKKPKVIAQCVNFDNVGAPFTNRIREAQNFYCSNKLNNATLIDCDTISKLKDGVHFSHIGYNSLSKEILSLINFN